MDFMRNGEEIIMSKITGQDFENITKAAQSAALLAGDLREIVQSDSILLSDAALDLVEIAHRLKTRLERMAMAAHHEIDEE